MKTELINRETALKRYNELKPLAFAIAEANGTLPGYSSAPECKLFTYYASLTQLKQGEQGLLINDQPAWILTDFYIDEQKQVIGRLCGENIISAIVTDCSLKLEYADGIIEKYQYIDDIDCWKFQESNVKLKLPQRGIN